MSLTQSKELQRILDELATIRQATAIIASEVALLASRENAVQKHSAMDHPRLYGQAVDPEVSQ